MSDEKSLILEKSVDRIDLALGEANVCITSLPSSSSSLSSSSSSSSSSSTSLDYVCDD